MKKLFSIGISIALLSLCGCAVLLLGSGVAGGIAMSKDTAKVERDASFRNAWAVTYDTLKDMGTINLEDKNAGKIEASIRDAKVTAQIIQITPKSVRIEIKSRKNLLPNIDLAMEIINKINSKL